MKDRALIWLVWGALALTCFIAILASKSLRAPIIWCAQLAPLFIAVYFRRNRASLNLALAHGLSGTLLGAAAGFLTVGVLLNQPSLLPLSAKWGAIGAIAFYFYVRWIDSFEKRAKDDQEMTLRDQEFAMKLEIAKDDPEAAKALWDETTRGLENSLSDLRTQRVMPTHVVWAALGLSVLVLAYAGFTYFTHPSNPGSRNAAMLLAGAALISLTAAGGLLQVRKQASKMEEIASEIVKAHREPASPE